MFFDAGIGKARTRVLCLNNCILLKVAFDYRESYF